MLHLNKQNKQKQIINKLKKNVMKTSTKSIENKEVKNSETFSPVPATPKKRTPAKKEDKPQGDLLKSLAALNISEKTVQKSSATRSIFKKDFNNKKDRTKCRNKFINSIQLYLIFISKDNKEGAEKELALAKEIAKTYYSAEDNFKNYSDYCTENMDEQKKGTIKLFVELLNK